MRCPQCGYVRPASAPQDAPAFHKPGCKVRRALQGAERKAQTLMDDPRLPERQIAGSTCHVVHGWIVDAIAPGEPPLRWMAQG